MKTYPSPISSALDVASQAMGELLGGTRRFVLHRIDLQNSADHVRMQAGSPLDTNLLMRIERLEEVCWKGKLGPHYADDFKLGASQEEFTLGVVVGPRRVAWCHSQLAHLVSKFIVGVG